MKIRFDHDEALQLYKLYDEEDNLIGTMHLFQQYLGDGRGYQQCSGAHSGLDEQGWFDRTTSKPYGLLEAEDVRGFAENEMEVKDLSDSDVDEIMENVNDSLFEHDVWATVRCVIDDMLAERAKEAAAAKIEDTFTPEQD